MQSFLNLPEEAPFSLQNLPYGVFVDDGAAGERIGVAIGDFVLDLVKLDDYGLLATLDADTRRALRQDRLNAFAGLGRPAWSATRKLLQRLLSSDDPTLRNNRALRDEALAPLDQVQMLLPFRIGDYTDFYSSRHHATNVGIMLRGPDNALMPNWLHLPIAYHGRASSVVVSGADVRRPHGQTKADDAANPTFGPSKSLDFELELGFFVGPGNLLGQPIPIAQAEEQIFGLVLVNDWSARDIQKWEYQPLGPFLAKNFATSISPWVVPLEALAPFRFQAPPQSPEPLPYLRATGPWGLNMHLEVSLQTAQMDKPFVISRSNARHLYWSLAQQLAHHAVNGCNLQPGDLLASGTISGPTPDSLGCLLELAWKGTRPIQLPSGETRVFLQDGDRVTITGWCQGAGYRVGLGEVTGVVLPAVEF